MRIILVFLSQPPWDTNQEAVSESDSDRWCDSVFLNHFMPLDNCQSKESGCHWRTDRQRTRLSCFHSTSHWRASFLKSRKHLRHSSHHPGLSTWLHKRLQAKILTHTACHCALQTTRGTTPVLYLTNCGPGYLRPSSKSELRILPVVDFQTFHGWAYETSADASTRRVVQRDLERGDEPTPANPRVVHDTMFDLLAYVVFGWVADHAHNLYYVRQISSQHHRSREIRIWLVHKRNGALGLDRRYRCENIDKKIRVFCHNHRGTPTRRL